MMVGSAQVPIVWEMYNGGSEERPRRLEKSRVKCVCRSVFRFGSRKSEYGDVARRDLKRNEHISLWISLKKTKYYYRTIYEMVLIIPLD